MSAVESAGGEREEAQLMSFDGTRSHPITPPRDDVVDFSPAWSPDGTAVAFARGAGSGRRWRTSIVTRSLATGAERQLVTVRAFPRLTVVGEPDLVA